MSSRRGGRRQKPKCVLIFGESENDTKLIAELFKALCPEFGGSVRTFRRPPILIRDASDRQLPGRVETISGLIEAERQTADVVCIFTHEDCDAVEPAHETLAERIESAFARAGYHVHAVAPAWETESWLFLWPEAVAAYRRSWASLDPYRGRNVGLIVDAKEELTTALRPKGRGAGNPRDYRESDAPSIAAKVREMGMAGNAAARSESYERFRSSVGSCCASVAPTS